jgi:ribonuclease HI
VFTDGSCINGRTGCAVFLPNEEEKYGLLDDASIFTAELSAIHQALLRIEESIEQLYPTRHPLLNQIQDVIHNLAVNKNIAFVWVPGHSNIQGNKTADKAATNLQMLSDLKMNTCSKINGNKQSVICYILNELRNYGNLSKYSTEDFKL